MRPVRLVREVDVEWPGFREPLNGGNHSDEAKNDAAAGGDGVPVTICSGFVMLRNEVTVDEVA